MMRKAISIIKLLLLLISSFTRTTASSRLLKAIYPGEYQTTIRNMDGYADVENSSDTQIRVQVLDYYTHTIS
jgi:hypothetical protein